MRFAVRREAGGVVLKINCPDCKLTAWQTLESDTGLRGEVPDPEELSPFVSGAVEQLTDRLHTSGCTHPMDADAVDRLVGPMRDVLTAARAEAEAQAAITAETPAGESPATEATAPAAEAPPTDTNPRP